MPTTRIAALNFLIRIFTVCLWCFFEFCRLLRNSLLSPSVTGYTSMDSVYKMRHCRQSKDLSIALWRFFSLTISTTLAAIIASVTETNISSRYSEPEAGLTLFVSAFWPVPGPCDYCYSNFGFVNAVLYTISDRANPAQSKRIICCDLVVKPARLRWSSSIPDLHCMHS
jgi:hypothetical protein